MKHIKYIFLLLIIGITTNCSDLTEETFTFIAPNNFYNNADDLEKAVIGVYDAFQGFYGSYGASRSWMYELEVSSGFGTAGYAGSCCVPWMFWENPNNDGKTVSIWGQCYSIINKANVVLDRGPDVEMDEAVKERMYAEVSFIRALAYYFLVRIYGGVAIPEGMTAGLEGLEIPRKSVDETYSYIISDLEYAISKLPVKSAYSESEIWRATKGAAQGILAEVYLTRGSMTGNSEFFTKSKQYGAAVITSGEYGLESDFKDLWFWWNPNDENGIESVFEVQYGKYPGENAGFHRNWGVNSNDRSTGEMMWRRITPTIDFYLGWSDADARKEATCLTKVYKTDDAGNILDSMVFVPEDNGASPGSKGWLPYGPGNNKHYDRTLEGYELQMSGNNFYLMRYADVLLNYAEAENELNGPTADAYEKINMVRNRAELPDLTTGLSKQAFSDSLFEERGYEFVGEVQLYFDGLRTDRLADYVKEQIETGVAKETFPYLRGVQTFHPKKDFLWKIPRYDLNSNPLLEQNPDNVSKY